MATSTEQNQARFIRGRLGAFIPSSMRAPLQRVQLNTEEPDTAPAVLEAAFTYWRSAPTALCTCGHTGDGGHSDHLWAGQPGTGACMVSDCKCGRFTWAGWLETWEPPTAKTAPVDPAHRCCVCGGWVDSDAGYDTCPDCVGRV